MLKRIVSGIMLTLLLANMLMFNIQSVEASGTINIRADGSVDPSTAPIQRNGNLYTFTADIYDSVVVERSNIVLDGAGYKIQGTRASNSEGIELSGRTNVTIQNMQITNFTYGIYIYDSSYNSIVGNAITNNGWGIKIYSSFNNNSVVGNTITDNSYGIYIYFSSGNTIFGNNIANSTWYSLTIESSDNNSVSSNAITNNGDGIGLYSSYGNSVSDNTITNSRCGIELHSSLGNSVSGNTFVGDGLMVFESYWNVIEDNIVNGKPLVYLENASNQSVGEAGQVILVNCEYIRVENLNLSNTTVGLQLFETNNTLISGNNITNNADGIQLSFSSNNIISGNTITNNRGYGIALDCSSNNTLRNNNMVGNRFNFRVSGGEPSFVNDVDVSNTVDGKPIYYWINKQDMIVPLDAGCVVLVDCTRITVQNLNLTNNGQGILLAKSNNTSIRQNNITNNTVGIYLLWSSYNSSSSNSIYGNTITNNTVGIHLSSSSNNSVSGNTITNNNYGIDLSSSSNNSIVGNNIINNGWYGIALFSSNNIIYHNNFIDNAQQAYAWGYHMWDDGYPSGGNFWSDYNGTDVYSGTFQNETGSDGIGDTPYIIDANNVDHYPIIPEFPSFLIPFFMVATMLVVIVYKKKRITIK